jgi:hypothetical protein
MKLRSAGQAVVDSGLVNEVGHKGVFVPTPRKDRNRPQCHLQYVHPSNLTKEKNDAKDASSEA